MRREIRICGFGGQGIILAGVVLGEAAAQADFHAVQTQSYGPESRGGAARAEVIIDSIPIAYPRVVNADVLVALSQVGYDRFADETINSGIVVVDSDLVKPHASVRALPFNKTAESLGRSIVANIVMLGYIVALLDMFPHEILEDTVLRNIPKGTEELNRRAVQAGRALFAEEKQ